MLERAKKLLSSISLAIPLIYIIGFIIVNAYLSKYSIYDVEALSFNYLKAGIFFIGILALSATCVFASFGKPTDNLSISFHKFFILIHNCFLVCSLLVIILFKPLSKVETPLIKHALFYGIGMLCFCLYLLSRLIIRDVANRSRKSVIIISIFQIGLLLIFLISVSRIIPVTYWLVWFFVMTTLIFTVNLGEYFDGKFNFLNLPLIFVGLASMCAFFGYFVYGHLPNYASGPKLNARHILFVDSIGVNNKKEIELKDKEIIYSGSSNYFIAIDDSTLLQVSNSNIRNAIYSSKP